MSDPMSTTMMVLGRSWSRTVTSMVWGQWLMLDTALRATQTVLGAAISPVAGHAAESGSENVIAVATERLRKGLAPPREIYEAPYRDQLDWSLFPEWARPSNPELFEGCSHEG